VTVARYYLEDFLVFENSWGNIENYQTLNQFCLKYKIYFQTVYWSAGSDQDFLLKIFGFLNHSDNYITTLAVWCKDKFINHFYTISEALPKFRLAKAERQGTHPACRSREKFEDKLPANYLDNLLRKATLKLG
jgi:hypothetical protein